MKPIGVPTGASTTISCEQHEHALEKQVQSVIQAKHLNALFTLIIFLN